MISDKSFDISFNPSRIFVSDNPIKSKSYCKVFIDVIGEGNWDVIPEDTYDIINDTVVFTEEPIGKYLVIQVATTPAELTQSPTENSIVLTIKNEIKTVANISGDIITLNGNILNVGIVADSIQDVIDVSGSITKVNTVADNVTDVTDVADNITSINTTSDNISEIVTVSDSITKVNIVADDITKVNTVADNITKIDSVANNITKVNTVADNVTGLNIVADNVTGLNIVADNVTGLNIVYLNIADILNVSDNMADINTIVDSLAIVENNVLLAEKWASELEDVTVADGKFSAYHWASKAYELVTNGIIDDSVISLLRTYSSQKVTDILALKSDIFNPIFSNHIAIGGSTISEWASTFKVIEGAGGVFFGTNGTSALSGSNAYYDGVNWRYKTNGTAGLQLVNQGTHTFRIAISGNAGDIITWTTIATLSAYGVVLPATTEIGNISATELQYLDGVTSNIQTQLESKASLTSPHFNGEPTAPTPTNGDNSTKIATTAFVLFNGAPTGTVISFASSTAPTGYLKANGALISRTTYASLFAVIGTTFGAGDGSNTFALPDLRGYFTRGYDDGRGIDTSRVFGTSQEDGFKAHTHDITLSTAANRASGSLIGMQSSGTTTSTSVGGTETRPKNIALLYCIKY